METKKVKQVSEETLDTRIRELVADRMLSTDEFIENHASGTLRKNKRLGMAWRCQYLTERTAYEFGYAFECTPKTRITIGEPHTMGDCSPITEAGWHIERYLTRHPFPEDKFNVGYLTVSNCNGKGNKKEHREGLGLVVEQTSAPFVPKGYVIFALIAEYDPIIKQYLEATII